MSCTQTRLRILTLVVVLASAWTAAPSVHAQETGGGQADTPAQTPNTPQNTPGPVGGIEQYQLEGRTLGHSNVTPRLVLSELYDSNGGYASTTNASQADGVATITGGVSLQWLKRQSTLALDYNAGGLIYNTGTQSNSVTQQLGVTDNLTLGRWNLVFAENFAYLPNTQFGLGGLGFLGGGTAGTLTSTGGTGGFNPNYQASSTIGTLNTYQLTSTSAVQAQYLLGARSSISVSGSVGFLHYFSDSNNMLDSRDVIARVGYDRSLTPRDTINVSYIASILSYPSGVQGFYSQYIQLGYRRILTGRLHLFVSAGPVISHFTPTGGATTVPGGENAVNWSVSSALDYALRNGTVGATYSRSITGGSGFLVGAVTDQLTGSVSHLFGRVWNASVTGGFSRNSSLEQTAPMTSTSSVFHYWTAGLSVSRPIGRFSNLRFSYYAQKQTSNTTMCVGGVTCGPIALVQTAGITYTWSTRPYRLD
jgi:hypothetical protein